MWAGGDNWLDEVSKAWPIIVSLGAIGAYFIGLFARSKANDKEIEALTEAVEKLVGTVAKIEEKQSGIHASVTHNSQRVTEACQDIGDLRRRADDDSRNINYILGRMDFGKNQRPGGQNDKR